MNIKGTFKVYHNGKWEQIPMIAVKQYDDSKIKLDVEALLNKDKTIESSINTIKDNVNTVSNNVGSILDLNTTNKSNIVSAINEINNKKGLSTTTQNLTKEELTQVQTNIGINNIINFIGYEELRPNLKIKFKDSYRDLDNEIRLGKGCNIYEAILVKPGTILKANLLIDSPDFSVSEYPIINAVFNPKNPSVRYVFFRSDLDESNIEICFDREFYIEIICTKIVNISIIHCDFINTLSPSITPYKDLFNAAGAYSKFPSLFYQIGNMNNERISEEEMQIIFAAGRPSCWEGYDPEIMFSDRYHGFRYKPIINLPPLNHITNPISLDFCKGPTTYINFGDNGAFYRPIPVKSAVSAFAGNYTLKKCINSEGVGVFFDFSLITDSSKIKDFCTACRDLQELNIFNLKINISFKDSPLLSKESIQHTVENAANSSPITITLHKTIYDKVSSETSEWGDLFTLSQTKNISFALG